MDRTKLTARVEVVATGDGGSRNQITGIAPINRGDEAPILARGEVQTPQGQRKAILLANLAVILDVVAEATSEPVADPLYEAAMAATYEFIFEVAAIVATHCGWMVAGVKGGD